VSDWGQDSEDLFREARGARLAGLSPSRADRDRVRVRIAARIGAAAVAGAVMTATTKAGAGVGAGAGAGLGAGGVVAKGATVALVAKIMLPLVIAGAAVVAAPRVLAQLNEPGATSPTTMTSPTTTTMTTSSAPPAQAKTREGSPAPALATEVPGPSRPIGGAVESVEAVAPVDPLPSSSAPARLAPRASASVGLSSEEATLVGEIDSALRGGDASTALRLAAEHERRFPRGVLTQEREGARVVARCMSGAASSSGASSFLAAHPRSPMRARIEAACDTGNSR
jgi:hypothetical protein